MRCSNCILSSLLVVMVCGTLTMNAQSADKPNQAAKSFSRTVTVEEKLNYLLFLPKDYDPARAEGWPMILFLHGAGERGEDLSLVKKHGPPRIVEHDPEFPFIVVSPQCPADRTWSNSELLGLLDQVTATCHVDTNRVYLTGLSMGGYGTWSLGLAYPERFAAIAPVCGGGEWISVVLASESNRQALQSLGIWAFHGAKDPVVPLAESERMVDALKKVGARDVKLTVYPEAGHDAWTETYDNPLFYQWLLQRRRSP